MRGPSQSRSAPKQAPAAARHSWCPHASDRNSGSRNGSRCGLNACVVYIVGIREEPGCSSCVGWSLPHNSSTKQALLSSKKSRARWPARDTRCSVTAEVVPCQMSCAVPAHDI